MTFDYNEFARRCIEKSPKGEFHYFVEIDGELIDLALKPGFKEAWDKYQKEELQKVKSHQNYYKRQALIKANGGRHSKRDIERQYCSQKGKCWHCGKPLNNKFHVDHLIPLSRGGTDFSNNIVCSCSECNLSKNNKLCSEWNGRLF